MAKKEKISPPTLATQKLTNITELISLVSMNGRVFLHKAFEELLLIELINHAESLTQQPIEPQVGPFLHTTLNDHISNLSQSQLAH